MYSALNLHYYVELAPVIVVGALAAGVSMCGRSVTIGNTKEAVKNLAYSTTLAVIVYMCLEATNLPYLARVGMASLTAFFGLDDAIGYFKKVLEAIKGDRISSNNPDIKE